MIIKIIFYIYISVITAELLRIILQWRKLTIEMKKIERIEDTWERVFNKEYNRKLKLIFKKKERLSGLFYYFLLSFITYTLVLVANEYWGEKQQLVFKLLLVFQCVVTIILIPINYIQERKKWGEL